MCFEAEEEEITITATNSAVPDIAALLFDIESCSQVTACCSLVLEVEDNEYDLCPGEQIVLDADYYGEEGSVEINWTSDPGNGIDYINDPTSISPTFLLPYDFPVEEQIIEYNITIQDDNCQKSETIYVHVQQNTQPEFDIAFV